MKKIIIWIIIVMFIMSITFVSVGCKEESVKEVEEAVEEVTEEEEIEVITTAEIDEFVIGVAAGNDTLDWFNTNGVDAFKMKGLTVNGLVGLDKSMNVVPSLAKDWKISDDRLEYTFYLEEGVKFHNGKEFTANDVKLTYDAYMNPDNAYVFASDFALIKSVEVVDKYIVKIALSEANSAFLSGIAGTQKPIFCEDSLRVNEDGILVADGMIGTGPYKFIEWEPEDYLTIEKFDDYFGGEANIKRIVFKIIPDSSVRLAGLQAGDIDYIMDPPQADVVDSLENPTDEYWKLELLEGTQAYAWWLVLNINPDGDFPTKNKALRKAIQCALDVDVIAKIVTKGLASTDNGAWPKGNVWESGIEPVDRDIEKAKQYLEEAGYPDGLDMVCLASDMFEFDNVAEVIQAQLADVGINIEVQVVEAAQWYDRTEKNEDFDMVVNLITVWVDPATLWNIILHSESVANWALGYYNTPEIDELLGKGTQTTDITERQVIYKEVNEILSEDAGLIFLYNLPMTYGIRSGYQGLELNSRGDFFFGKDKGIPWLTKIAE